jgi:hypothetical protein
MFCRDPGSGIRAIVGPAVGVHAAVAVELSNVAVIFVDPDLIIC